MRRPRPTCSQCSAVLPAAASSTRRTCSPRCRKRASRADRAALPPAELRALPRWVRASGWKVPLTVAGTPANTMDPTTWADYRTASTSTVGRAPGFVLTGDGIVCLDLDHCLDASGRLSAAVAALLELAPPTWIERSVSGTGLHVWGRATGLPAGRRRVTTAGVAVEVYSARRYIALGTPLPGTPASLADVTDLALAALST